MCWNCLKCWLLDIIIPNENKDDFFIHENNIYEFSSSMKKGVMKSLGQWELMKLDWVNY